MPRNAARRRGLYTPVLADALCRPGTVLLDAPRLDADSGRRGAVLFSDPRHVLRADAPHEVGPLLDAVDAALGEGRHVAGFLSYEAGAALVGLTAGPQVPGVPLAWFGVYDAPHALDPADLDAALAQAGPAGVSDVALGVTPEAYRDAIAAIHARIRAGDVYQVNLTAPLRFGLDGDAWALYAALRCAQHVAYGAFVRLDGIAVASVSPELFFRVDRDGESRTVTTRPMKGTAPRGATPVADRRLAEDLLASPKDRAENLMIVDLLRNDVSRVSEPGSVRVPALFQAERYETVTQMTSTVTGTLRPDVALGDVVRALFPCGSVTGAPKRRAMEVIRTVETEPRGVYCGAIGAAAPDGTAAFSVAIRTAVVRGAAGRYDVGSGVVWDSVADAEYAECLLKGRVLTDLA